MKQQSLMKAWKLLLLLLLWRSQGILLQLGLKRHAQLSSQGWHRVVCENTAVIAGDPEKRETKPQRRSVPVSSQDISRVLCTLGEFFHSQDGLFTQDDRLLADCAQGGPTAIGIDNLISFPTTKNNQMLFPLWKMGRYSLCSKPWSTCELQGESSFIFVFCAVMIALWRLSMGHVHTCRGSCTWIKTLQHLPS